MNVSDRVKFITKAHRVHGDFYDYSDFEYSGSRRSGAIICRTHGKFMQRANHHLTGAGCPSCGNLRISKSKKSNLNDFLSKARQVHSARYDYSNFVYNGNDIKSVIACEAHGEFLKTPHHHLDGQGCPKCSLIEQANRCRLSKDEFLKKAHVVHDNLYTYDDFVYLNAHQKSFITCGKHGNFLQTPTDHAHGHGCPRCSNKISKRGTKWLDSLGITTIREHKIELIDGRSRKVDGYDPRTNTIFEFHGDYYHGNPKVYRCPITWNKKVHKFMWELHEMTIQNDALLRKSDYRLVAAWEHDVFFS